MTLSLIVCTIAAVIAFPEETLRTFLGIYLALEILCLSGLVGYAIASYLSLVIAVLIACRPRLAGNRPTELPGLAWLFCLAGLVFLQFFRSASLHDAFPIICDEAAFTLVLWKLPQICRPAIRSAVSALIVGTCGTGLVFLLLSPTNEYRLGLDVGFNPNELGNVAGAVLLLLISNFFIKGRHIAFWGMSGILAALLFRSQSRTSIYAFFGALVLFLFLRRKRRIALSFTLIVVAFMAFSYVKQFDADASSLVGRIASPMSESFDESSAQRAVIWGFLLTEAGNHWKWGVGLRNVPEMTAAVGIGVSDATDHSLIGYQSHNLYLTLLLESGILGLFFLIGWQLKLLAWGARRPFDRALLISMMFYLIIQGFFQGLNLSFFSAFLLVAAYCGQSEPDIRSHTRALRPWNSGTIRASG